MKKVLGIIAVVVLSTGIFVSCSKSKSSSSANGSLKATAGGVSVSSNYCFTAESDSTLAIDGFNLNSTASVFPYITVQIDQWNGAAGTFAFDSTSNNGIGYYFASASVTKTANHGSVTITSVSATDVNGTFTFTCTDGTVISGGTFDAKR